MTRAALGAGVVWLVSERPGPSEGGDYALSL